MKTLMTFVTLATLMGSPALAQTSGDDPSLFSVGPSETPLEFVVVEGKVKGSIENRNDGLRPGRTAE